MGTAAGIAAVWPTGVATIVLMMTSYLPVE
jgi:hypothetical protein